ncbi:MAG: DUF4339 domain-containing protein [Thermoguttaceae bacterium]|nr:DUF4339 domain-containing protein [Thermoguttaceae bacterium]
MSKYYVKVVGRAFGPLPSERIVQMIKDGKINRETEISADAVDWRPAAEVAEFYQAFNAGLPGASPLPMGQSYGAEWFVTIDGSDQLGPLTSAQIVDALRAGSLPPTARAWRQGENARPLGEILEFQATPRAAGERSEWYYSSDGQTGYGPYTVSEILSFVQQGRADFNSLVWRQGESSRPMRTENAFMQAYNAARGAANVPVAGAPNVLNGRPSAIGGAYPTANSYDEDLYGSISPFYAERRNRRIKLLYTMIWSSFCVAFTCGALGMVFRELGPESALSSNSSEWTVALFSFLSTILFIVSSITSIFAAVTSFVFVFNFWKSIPRKFARTSPGVALGLLFVPLFNLYWSFVTFRGGSLDLDSSLQYYAQHGMNQNERPKHAGLFGGTTFAILTVAMFVFCVIAAGLSLIPSEDSPSFISRWEASRWAAVSLTVSIFLLPLYISGCFTTLWAALAAIMLFGCFAVEEPAAIFVLVVLLIICLYFALYPLFFVLCMRRVRTAALQMNSWRAGMPSEQGAAGANGPRVTLDDVINS